jgi:transcriptional regulator with XRE-family HTH domain
MKYNVFERRVNNLSSINDRINQVVSESGLTKTAIAKKLNVSQQYISKLTKTGEPSDLFTTSFCREFGINKSWLISGTGNKYIKNFIEDEYMRAATELKLDGDETMIQAVIEYWKMTPEQRCAVKHFISSIASNLKENEE